MTAAERAVDLILSGLDRWADEPCDPVDIVERLMADPALLVDLAIEAGAPTQHQLALQLQSLLDFAERHQLSYADHGHDCFELWCIERDHSRMLIEDVLGRTTQENDQ